MTTPGAGSSESPAAKAVRGARRGVWAVLDQGAFAGTNFVLNVLLARWLTPEDYGTFVVVFSAMLFASGIYTAIVTEPLLIFGARNAHRGYLNVVVRGHWWVVVAMALALVATGILLPEKSHYLTSTFIAMAAALPFIMFQWLTRRACYVFDVPRSAALAGLLYFALTVLGAFAIEMSGATTPITSFILLGAASLCASLALSWKLRVPILGRYDAEQAAVARREHTQYGRWAAGSNALVWVRNNVYYFILPLLGGLAASGELRAALNLVMPLLHVFLALSTVLLAMFSRTLKETGEIKGLVRIVAATCVVSSVYAVGIWLFGGLAFDFIYHGKYQVSSATLICISVLPVVGGINAVLGTAVRAHTRSDIVFRGTVAASIATLAIGLPMVAKWGVSGAIGGMLVGFAVSGLAYAGWLRGADARRNGVASSPDVTGGWDA